MNKRKSIIIMLITFLAIGFATVSATLIINGLVGIGENTDDFDIVFTSARLNGIKKNNFISEDKKHINFASNELKTLDDKATLTYEVTNTSRNYDADVSVTCSAATTGLINFEFTPHEMEVFAGETKFGTFTASLIQVVDESLEVQIECTLTATAKQRESLGEKYIEPFSKSGVMVSALSQNTTPTPQGMWAYRSNVTKVVFEDKLEPHEVAADLIFDVSSVKDKSVMAYLVPNGENLTTNKTSDNKNLEDTSAYTLYIQGDTGIICNSDSSIMFSRFNNLLKIENLEYLDTSNVTDMHGMFNYCENLKELDLSSFDTSKVVDMQYMFENCESLTSFNLSGFDTSNVTNMAGMFRFCTGLTSIDLKNFDTSKVRSMSEMFYMCDKLSSLDLSGFNTSRVENMQSMFDCCQSIMNLNISNFDTSNVTNMSSMFEQCLNLTDINLSSFNTSKVTAMRFMFATCNSLSSLDISNFVTTNVNSMYYMFSNCKALTELNLSSFDTSNVTNMSSMFDRCTNLKILNLSSFNTSKVTTMSSMFGYCENLTEIILDNFDTTNVTSMSNMFWHCSKLKTIDVSTFDTSNVTDMRSMFAYCSKLEKLDLSNFITTNLSLIGENGILYVGMFYYCNSLTVLDISNFDFGKITSKYSLFSDMPSNATIKLKDKDAQDWVLALDSHDRPTEWTTDNVVIKTA